jgi:hypothetical protein
MWYHGVQWVTQVQIEGAEGETSMLDCVFTRRQVFGASYRIYITALAMSHLS